MRHLFIICICLPGLIASGLAAGPTALDAVKLLPREHRARVARIEARDGTPEPERWHILVSDPSAENGLREFVVARGAIVAERGISQFAESVAPGQMLGDGIRFDSDRAAQIVQRFAKANSVTVAVIAYQLRKDTSAAIPLWRLTCFDPIGKEVGSISLTATKGGVISNQGFPIEPSPVRDEKPRERMRITAAPPPVRERTVQATPIPAAPEPAPEKRPGLIERIFRGNRPGTGP